MKQSQHPLYRRWRNMKDRCDLPSHRSYPNYGGRGIFVCERWRDSFLDFLKDVGKRPSNKYSLDRIDNNKGYFPDNCRWTTQDIQTANRRRSRDTSSRYRGVSIIRKTGKWKVAVRAKGYNHNYLHVGNFNCEREAAKAYDAKVVEMGLRKIINFPEDYKDQETNILNKIQ